MMMTFDFALMAQRDAELMKAITDAMSSPKNEVVCTDIHKLSFFPSKKTVVVTALSETSPFHYKVVPKEISYSAVIKMLNKNWNDICEDEIRNI
ncbi:MAG: hypothetical protein IJ446_03650 [Oscillospiraceae bacterium]|nr:hypothetical protein [Oscillospiraceae bacterium]